MSLLATVVVGDGREIRTAQSARLDDAFDGSAKFRKINLDPKYYIILYSFTHAKSAV